MTAAVHDRFGCVLGNGRGATRDGDDTPEHERLRERAAACRGYTVCVYDNGGELTVKPLCQTATYLGTREHIGSYEATGELGWAPDAHQWVATLCTGRWDSKLRWVVARGARLGAVLDALADALGDVASGRDGEQPLTALRDGGRPVRLDAGTVADHLDFVESLP